MWGAIGAFYHHLGGIRSRLGFPLTNEIPAALSPQGTTGVCQRFEGSWDYPDEIHGRDLPYGASVYWSVSYGTYATWGGIGEYFERLGGTWSSLGFPISGELEAAPSPQGTSGWYQRFEGGHIYWCEQHGGVPVLEPILAAFIGGTGGKFGFPIAPALVPTESPGVLCQEFEGGMICALHITLLETSHPDMRIVLFSPEHRGVVHHTPIHAAGRVEGLPSQRMYSLGGYVRTNAEYDQGRVLIEKDGSWSIENIHLGAETQLLFFRVFDEDGSVIAESKEVTLFKR